MPAGNFFDGQRENGSVRRKRGKCRLAESSAKKPPQPQLEPQIKRYISLQYDAPVARLMIRRAFATLRPLPFDPKVGHKRSPRPAPAPISEPSSDLSTEPNPKYPQDGRRNGWRRTFIRKLSFWALLPVKIYLFGHLFIAHVYSINGTYGPSMLPTIAADNDWFIFSKWFYRRGRNIQVGDIVSFKHPVIEGSSVKRVVGMPGDFVLRDTPGQGEGLMIQVPDGHCWVVGDNLPWSRDSRMFGPLPLALIKAKVIARYSPKFAWTENTLQEPEA